MILWIKAIATMIVIILAIAALFVLVASVLWVPAGAAALWCLWMFLWSLHGFYEMKERQSK